MATLGRLLMYEASRDWLLSSYLVHIFLEIIVELRMCFSIWNIKYPGWQPTVAGDIQSPMAITLVEFIDLKEPIVIVPILRAGLTLAEHASSVFLATKTYHLGKVGQCFLL
ncbi:hypothetical protein Gohar_020565 [Gossypium harknessii]|uniref:Uncharacterized protein n=1 Tax=Gossypium harknessii TaxID=34285 RepID=A0A7J9HYP4_9ROSI|nr:hypothetical protein [Gossypium harknessii]